MTNKAGKLHEIIKKTCTQELCVQVSELFVEQDKATNAKQGKAIKDCLEIMQDNQVDVTTVMRQCNCLSDSVIAKAKKSYVTADGNVDKFLQLLNEQHIGGGKLHINDDGKIVGIYSQCYCGVPKVTKNMPLSYCECSAGWFEKLFSSVFERKVEVKLIHTILSGASECVFEIA